MISRFLLGTGPTVLFSLLAPAPDKSQVGITSAAYSSILQQATFRPLTLITLAVIVFFYAVSFLKPSVAQRCRHKTKLKETTINDYDGDSVSYVRLYLKRRFAKAVVFVDGL